MVKGIYLLWFVTILINCSSSKGSVNVLFIGNSLTSFNGMPDVLKSMLKEAEADIVIEQSVYPGMSLTAHLTDIIVSTSNDNISTRVKSTNEFTNTELIIGKKNWDYVIFQSGSIEFLISEFCNIGLKNAMYNLKSLVTNKKCKFVLFDTWIIKGSYPKKYCSNHPIECCTAEITNREMEFNLLKMSYDSIALKFSLKLAKSCEKYFEILLEYPDVDLYEDNMHPSKYGAFLNGCIFFEILTGIKPSEIIFTGDIDKNIASLLKKVVSE